MVFFQILTLFNILSDSHIAQLVERLPPNWWVCGSNPTQTRTFSFFWDLSQISLDLIMDRKNPIQQFYGFKLKLVVITVNKIKP